MKEAESFQSAEITSYSPPLYTPSSPETPMSAVSSKDMLQAVLPRAVPEKNGAINKDLAQPSTLHKNLSVLQAMLGTACNRDTGTYRGNYMQKGKIVKNKLGN